MTKSKTRSANRFLEERKRTVRTEVINYLRYIEISGKISKADKGRTQKQISVALCLGLLKPRQFSDWLRELCTEQNENGEIVKPADLLRIKKAGAWTYYLSTQHKQNLPR